MKVVYDKIAIDNCWSSRASSPDSNTATVSPAINKDPLMRGPPRMSGSRVYHRCCCKMLKMQHVFASNGLSLGATVPGLTLLERSRRRDSLAILEIFEPKMVPFVTPHLVTPKDMATNRRAARSGTTLPSCKH